MTSQLPRFWCLFLSCRKQKNTEKWADVTSLRSFLFCQGFNKHFLKKFSEKYFLAHHFSKLLGNYIICLHYLFSYFSILLHFLKKKIVCCLLTIMSIHKKSRRHIIQSIMDDCSLLQSSNDIYNWPKSFLKSHFKF